MKNKLAAAVKSFCKAAIDLYICIAIVTSTILLTNDAAKPDEYNQYKAADNISLYFSYLAQNKVTPESSVSKIIPLQMLLLEAGQDLGPCGADGIFGRDTMKAVFNYKKRHGLPILGIDVDYKIYNHLITHTLNDPAIYSKVEKKLIEPYTGRLASQLVNNLEEVFNTVGYSILLRPDVLILGLHQAFTNKFRVDPATMHFSGSTNLHVADAFRHSDSFFRIADVSNGAPAILLGDILERARYHDLELFLMDTYNHRAAVRLLETYEAAGMDTDNTEE